MVLKQYKDVAVNVVAQWVVQIANYLVPLFVIPYVSRVLEPEMFGAAAYAQNIVAYFTFLVNFGFGISATQEVALNKENKECLNSIFNSVVCFQTLMLALTFALIFALCLFSEKVQAQTELFFAASLFNIGVVLFPYWFFQGVERMAKMSMFLLLVRVLGLVLVFLFVKEPCHAVRYLYALSAANIAVGALSFMYVVRTFGIKVEYAEGFMKAAVVKKSVPAFLNAFFVNCNVLVGMTMLGYYLTDYDLGVYSGAQKIMMAVLMVTTQSVSVALFPRVSRYFAEDRESGFRRLGFILLVVGVFSALVSVVFYIASPVAVLLMLGEKYAVAVPVLRQLSALPFLYTIATTLTVQGVFAMQLQRYAPGVGLVVFVCNLLLCFLLVPVYGISGAVVAWLACQVVEVVADLVVIGVFRK